jgi:hypothetical protein
MARHRHAVSVRTDGLAAVLGPLLTDPRIRSAALIDVDSGMVLDVCGPETSVGRFGRGRAAEHDHRDEVRGAAHAELVRIGLALAPGSGGVVGLVLEAGPDQHVLHTVADPHGGLLALSVVVRGPDRVVAKVRKRLRVVSESALTAGPSVAVRPGSAAWSVPGPPGAPVDRAAGPNIPPAAASTGRPGPPGPGRPVRPAVHAMPGPVSSVPAALPSPRPVAGDPVHDDDGSAVQATTPHAAITPSAPPEPSWPGPGASLSAMLPSPRPLPDAPAAPSDSADPAPAER